MSSPDRALVLGDLHLGPSSAAAVGEDLASLLKAHPGARVIFAGDSFDIDVGPGELGRSRAIGETLQAQPALRAALGRRPT